MVFGIIIVRVLDDALADFKRQIQPAKRCVAKFEVFDNAERVQVVIERKPMLAHGGVERFFSGVAERGMAEIVHQGERFCQIGVEAKLCGDGARNLRYLDGVRQPVAEVIGVTAGKNLRLRFQPAKGAGMNDTIAVALKVVAVGMRRLGMAASAGVFYAHRIVGEHEQSLAAFVVVRLVHRRDAGIAEKAVLRLYRSPSNGIEKKDRLGDLCVSAVKDPEYYFAPSSLASFIFAESSFLCTRTGSAGSTSAAMLRFHSVSARSQLVAASFRRPVFWYRSPRWS